MERQEREESSLRGLRQARRRSAEPSPAAGLVQTETLKPGQDLPLMIRPVARDLDLAGWAAGQRELLEGLLYRHGAVLFRGFQLGSVPEFERFASSLAPDLYGEYGDLPREEEGGKVYRSTPYPQDKTILFHNESSHMHRWPMKQFFYCVKAAEKGGATPLLDCRAVYESLPPEVLEPFERKGLVYVRNFTPGLDVSWQDFFRTEDRSVIEDWCRQAGLEITWKGEGLQTRQRSRAVAVHPKTGRKVFFNQIQLHHPYCLEPEVRQSLVSVFGEDGLPRNVVYGDGSRIEDEVMDAIGRLYWDLAVRFPWQEGDVVLLDNMLTAHARDPYSGPRKIVVALGEILHAAEL